MHRRGKTAIPVKSIHFGRRLLLCLLLAALILGASWLALRRLGIRPFSFDLPEISLPGDNRRDSREIALSGHALYALQLGAFTQESAARQLAQTYISRGAAGYVYNDDGTWRVLAAAYPTRAEAQTVQTRLSGQQISTYIHPLRQEAVTLRAGGTAGQTAALGEALEYLSSLGDKLFSLSQALDTGGLTGEQGREALQSEGVTSAALESKLQSAFGGGLPEALEPIARTLREISDCARAALHENSAARTGAALKACQLTVFFGLLGFCQGLA